MNNFSVLSTELYNYSQKKRIDKHIDCNVEKLSFSPVPSYTHRKLVFYFLNKAFEWVFLCVDDMHPAWNLFSEATEWFLCWFALFKILPTMIDDYYVKNVRSSMSIFFLCGYDTLQSSFTWANETSNNRSKKKKSNTYRNTIQLLDRSCKSLVFFFFFLLVSINFNDFSTAKAERIVQLESGLHK